MIDLYAAAHHTHSSQVDAENIDAAVPDREALKAYTHKRIEQCRYRSGKQKKPFCNVCPIHCYKPEMRRQIRAVMRYSGPRMLLYAPGMALRHIFIEWREKRR